MAVHYIADTLSGGATVTAPTAGATIANVGATPPAGVYEIRVKVNTGPGAVAADWGNMKLGLNGSTYIASLVPGIEHIIPRVTLNGVNGVVVQAIGNATASVPYTATLAATACEP